jgi:hypothetical protein
MTTSKILPHNKSWIVAVRSIKKREFFGFWEQVEPESSCGVGLVLFRRRLGGRGHLPLLHVRAGHESKRAEVRIADGCWDFGLGARALREPAVSVAQRIART